jgi:hypothetical protein
VKEPAEVLFLAADQSVDGGRALDREARAIQRAVEDGRPAGAAPIRVTTRWSAAPLDLLREVLAVRPIVLHLGGTGLDGAGGLCLRDEGRRVHLVTAEAIAGALDAAGSSIEVVVLSGCYSTPLADALCAVVDCVLGSNEPEARGCMAELYRALARGESVESAAERAGMRDSIRLPTTRAGALAREIYVGRRDR